MVPERVLLAHANVTNHLRLIDLRAFTLVLHCTIFTEAHNGFTNAHVVENQVDCSIGVAMVKDVDNTCCLLAH
jgi:hypothetical protein